MTCIVCRGRVSSAGAADGAELGSRRCVVSVAAGLCRVAIAGCRADLMGAEGCKKVCADGVATFFV